MRASGEAIVEQEQCAGEADPRLRLVPGAHLVQPGLEPDGGLGVGASRRPRGRAARGPAPRRRRRAPGSGGRRARNGRPSRSRARTADPPRPCRPRRSPAGRAVTCTATRPRASSRRPPARHPRGRAERLLDRRTGAGRRPRSAGRAGAKGCRRKQAIGGLHVRRMLATPSRAAPAARSTRAARRSRGALRVPAARRSSARPVHRSTRRRLPLQGARRPRETEDGRGASCSSLKLASQPRDSRVPAAADVRRGVRQIRSPASSRSPDWIA